jgi:hypothetical protein
MEPVIVGAMPRFTSAPRWGGDRHSRTPGTGPLRISGQGEGIGYSVGENEA